MTARDPGGLRQARGPDGIQAPHTRIEDMASAYRRELVQAQYDAIQRYRARRQPLFSAHDRGLGWGRLVDELAVQDVPGNHRAVLQRPHVGELTARLEAALAGERPEPTLSPWDRPRPGTR